MSERLRQPFTVQDVLSDAEYVSGIEFPSPIPVADPKTSKNVDRLHSRRRHSSKPFTAIPETEKSLGRVEEDAPCQPPAAMQADDSQRRLESIAGELEKSSARVCEESGKFCQQKSELVGVHRLQNRYPFKMPDPKQETRHGNAALTVLFGPCHSFVYIC
jgi:hypothetical protein